MPLTIPREDEELYRDAEKLLINYLNKFQEKYNQKSMEEVLTFTAYQLAVISAKQSKKQDIDPLAVKVQEINKKMADLLV